MHSVLVSLVVGFLVSVSASANAQPQPFFKARIAEYQDLVFPVASRSLGAPSPMGNDVFRPAGNGPFPAVVLVHTCGGIEPHMYERAAELVNAGYMVLVLDSYTVRKHFTFCTAAGVGAPRLYKDAYDAMTHLQRMPEVDPEKIYLVGMSLGSFAAANASSPEVAAWLDSKTRFRASVGWYGSCSFNVGSFFPPWELLRRDADRPVLLLLAERDSETPIKSCFPLMEEMKAQGKPVAWHVYPTATHAWDKENPRRGYRRDEKITADAMRRTIEFLKAN